MNQQQQFQTMATIGLVYLVLFLVGSIFFAIGNYFIAKRLGKTKWLWALLTLIPGVNIVFLYYMIYQIIYGILDRLPAPGRAAAQEF
jgi:hypothetical protein